MTTSARWVATLLLTFAILHCQSILVRDKAAKAPPFFSQADAVRDVQRETSGSHVKLSAPDHLDRYMSSKDDDNAALAHRLIDVQQKRTSLQASLRAKRAAARSSNTTHTSSTNADDSSQGLGYLGYGYNAPLNLSSSDESQSVFVQLDTGSADLWVVSSSCKSEQCSTNAVLKFDQTRSQSFGYLEPPTTTEANGSTQDANVTVTAQGAEVTGSGSSPSPLDSNGGDSQNEKRRVLAPVSFATEGDSIPSDSIPFSVLYNDGTAASGALAQDSVSFAGLSSSRQVFGLVTDTNVTLADQGISGVLGLGFPRGSAIARSLIGDATNAHATPLLTTLLLENNSSYPLFTLLLNQTNSRMTVGAADSQILTARTDRDEVEWHDVVPFPSGNTGRASNATVNRDAESLDAYLYWTVGLTAAGYNGSGINVEPTYTQVGQHAIALLDSGAPGLVGPPSAVSELFSQIAGARHVGAGRFVVPCTTQGRMFFNFGGRNYTLLPSDYIIGPASGNPYLCLAWPAAAQGSADGVDWTLGLPFLQAQYTLFSLGIAGREGPKVGLYPLRAPADTTDQREVFADQDAASVSAYVKGATPIATTLPNSIVPFTTAFITTQPYVFENATSTATLGQFPTRAGTAATDAAAIAPSTYVPLLTAETGDERLPVLSSGVKELPVPSNPAEDRSNAATTVVAMSTLTGQRACLAIVVCSAVLFAS